MTLFNRKIPPIYFVLSPELHGQENLVQAITSSQDVLSLGGHDLPDAPAMSLNPTVNKWTNGIISLIANEVGSKSWKLVYEPAETFFAAYDRFFNSIEGQGAHKACLSDSASALSFMTMSSMEFPVGGVIHLVRDPRAYVAARKRDYPEIPTASLAMEWRVGHGKLRRLKSLFSKVPFMTLRYEDFVESSQTALEKMAEFMKIRPGQAGIPAPLEGENWRETMALDDQKRVIQASGALFSELGYKT